MSRYLKFMLRYKTKLKVEKLCCDIEIDCRDIKDCKRKKLCRDRAGRSGRQALLSLSQQGFLCYDIYFKG